MRTSGAVINLEKQQDKKDGQRLDEIKQNITYTFITLLSFGSLFPLTPVLLAWLSIQCLLVYYQAVYLDDTRRCVFKDKHGEIQPICNASGQPIANYLTLSESQSSGDMFRYNAKTSTYSPQQGPLVDGTKAKHFQQAQSTLRKTSEPSQENKYFRRHNNHAKASWLFMSIMPMLEFAVRPLVKVINILLLEVSAIEMCDNLYKTGSVNAMPSVQPKMTDRNGSNGVKKKAFIAKKHNKVLLQKVLSYTMSLAYISVCATIQSIFWLLDKIAEILHAFKFYRHCHWLLEISSQIIYWASAGVVLYQYFVTPSVPSMIMAACMAFVMIEKYKLVPASMRERLEQLRFIMPNIHLMFSLISGSLGKNFLPAGNVITKLWAIVDLGLSLFFLITQTLGYVISKTGKMIVALLTSGITRVSGLINLAIEAHKRYKNNRKLSKLDKTGSQFLVDHVLASFYTITRSSQAKQNQSSTTEVELWPEHLNTYKGDIKATSRAWKELSQDFMCLDEHIKTLTQHAYSSRIDQLSSTLSLNPAFFDNRSSGSLNTEDQSIPTQINAARMADFLTESSQADIRLWEDFCKSYNDVQTENDIEKSVIDAFVNGSRSDQYTILRSDLEHVESLSGEYTDGAKALIQSLIHAISQLSNGLMDKQQNAIKAIRRIQGSKNGDMPTKANISRIYSQLKRESTSVQSDSSTAPSIPSKLSDARTAYEYITLRDCYVTSLSNFLALSRKCQAGVLTYATDRLKFISQTKTLIACDDLTDFQTQCRESHQATQDQLLQEATVISREAITQESQFEQIMTISRMNILNNISFYNQLATRRFEHTSTLPYIIDYLLLSAFTGSLIQAGSHGKDDIHMHNITHGMLAPGHGFNGDLASMSSSIEREILGPSNLILQTCNYFCTHQYLRSFTEHLKLDGPSIRRNFEHIEERSPNLLIVTPISKIESVNDNVFFNHREWLMLTENPMRAGQHSSLGCRLYEQFRAHLPTGLLDCPTTNEEAERYYELAKHNIPHISKSPILIMAVIECIIEDKFILDYANTKRDTLQVSEMDKYTHEIVDHLSDDPDIIIDTSKLSPEASERATAIKAKIKTIILETAKSPLGEIIFTKGNENMYPSLATAGFLNRWNLLTSWFSSHENLRVSRRFLKALGYSDDCKNIIQDVHNNFHQICLPMVATNMLKVGALIRRDKTHASRQYHSVPNFRKEVKHHLKQDNGPLQQLVLNLVENSYACIDKTVLFYKQFICDLAQNYSRAKQDYKANITKVLKARSRHLASVILLIAGPGSFLYYTCKFAQDNTLSIVRLLVDNHNKYQTSMFMTFARDLGRLISTKAKIFIEAPAKHTAYGLYQLGYTLSKFALSLVLAATFILKQLLQLLDKCVYDIVRTPLYLADCGIKRILNLSIRTVQIKLPYLGHLKLPTFTTRNNQHTRWLLSAYNSIADTRLYNSNSLQDIATWLFIEPCMKCSKNLTKTFSPIFSSCQRMISTDLSNFYHAVRSSNLAGITRLTRSKDNHCCKCNQQNGPETKANLGTFTI